MDKLRKEVVMDKILQALKLDQKSTWTGSGSIVLLAAVFGAPDAQVQAVCGVAIALINAFDIFRNEVK